MSFLPPSASFGVNSGTPGPGILTLINISAHSPFGGLTTASLGNGLAESRSYTPRGWLGSIGVGSVYTLNSSSSQMGYDGNGNVTSANDNINGSWTYTYDGANRLHTASETGQSFTYTYDQFGNMTCSNTGSLPCTPSPFAISTSTNRITTSGYTYDSNGNLLTDNTHGYVYDTENRLTCVVDPSGGLCTTSGATVYTYDAEDRRVAKTQGNGVLIEDEVYDLQEHQSSAHSGSTVLRSEFYGLATYAGSTWTFHHADWLGTVRANTNSSGQQVGTFTDTPFGMNMNCSASPSPMHFTGLQCDPETGMTHALHRQYPVQIGRWLTADPAGKDAVKLDDPQTWNLYAYVRNDPLTLTDPSGLEPPTPVPDCSNNSACTGQNGQNGSSGGPNGSSGPGQGWDSASNYIGNYSSGNDGEWAQNNNNQQAPAAKISERDKAYLDKYYGPVTAQAKDDKVDPVLVLGVGIESGFASQGTYQRTGDAFGMTGGSTKNMTEAASPTENVKQFFNNYGSQIQGTGSNVRAFVNALEGQNAAGKPVKGWKVYNSAHPVEWRKMINAGISQMKHDVPIYTAPN